MKEAAEKLPEVVNHLQKNLPGIAETLSHLLGGIAAAEAAASDSPAVHWGVTCDKSGMQPIVGVRYKKKHDNYDLCQAEFDKLDEPEKAQYLAIERPHQYHAEFNCGMPSRRGDRPGAATPATQAQKAQPAVHWGITCDKSGQSPIIGPRFKMVGRDYDLNEAEYDKLPASERPQFERIDFPRHCPWTPRASTWGPGPARSAWNAGDTLQARFVRDDTIFDGTEMAPGTPFTKIWTVRNDGTDEWPEGVKLQCVGGDDLQAPHRVKLQHDGKVAPGEEVQLAVDLVAPQRAGRYIANFRLVSPSGKRFGQRIWCTLHVVDNDADNDALGEQHGTSNDKLVEAAAPAKVATAPAPAPALPNIRADVVATAAEDVAAVAPTAAEPVPPFAPTARTPSAPDVAAAATGVASGDAVVVVERTADAVPVVKPRAEAEPVGATDGKGEVGVLESRAPPAVSPQPTNADSDSVCSDTVVISAEEQVTASLESMGFTDPELNAAVFERERGNLEACAGTLLTLSEWSKALGDLKVMGFADVRRNVDLLLKHDGDIRLTVKELVSA